MKKSIFVFLALISFSSMAMTDLICEAEIPGSEGESITLKFDIFEAQGQYLSYVQYDSEFYSNAFVPGCSAAMVQESEGSLSFTCFNPEGAATGSAAIIAPNGKGLFRFANVGPLGFEQGGDVRLSSCKKADFTSNNPFE